MGTLVRAGLWVVAHAPFPPGRCPGSHRAARMEPAATRWPFRVGRVRVESEPLFSWRAAKLWERPEEGSAVWVFRLLGELDGRSHLDDPTEVHDGDEVAHVADDGEVVRNEQHREAELPLEVSYEVEDGALHGDVEGGRDLVRDEHSRSGRKRPCDGNSLPLATRQGSWQAVGDVRAELHELEETSHFAA